MRARQVLVRVDDGTTAKGWRELVSDSRLATLDKLLVLACDERTPIEERRAAALNAATIAGKLRVLENLRRAAAVLIHIYDGAS